MKHYADTELEGLLSLDEAMDGLARAFREHARGAAPVQPRIPTDFEALRLNTMAAIIPALGVCGAKVYTALGTQFSFVVLLFSSVDGRMLASFDAGALTRLRTAAVSALALERLARSDSRRVALFGTGTQARVHAEMLSARLPLEEIRIVGRENAAAFARAIAARTGVPARAMRAGDAIAGADVVVTATRARAPLFDGNALPEGCCVIAVGACRPDAAEIDAATVRRAAVIAVESAGQVKHESGDLIAAETAGVPVWNRLVELGAILAGETPGRSTPHQITLFESLGFALEDIAIAALAHSKLTGSEPQ